MMLLNTTKKTVIVSELAVADNFFKRFMGLMGKNDLPQGKGLMIKPCNSIHMFFMKIPLDILFVDRDNKIIHIIKDIKPWKVSKIVPGAVSAIELPIGTIDSSNTEVSDFVTFKI